MYSLELIDLVWRYEIVFRYGTLVVGDGQMLWNFVSVDRMRSEASNEKFNLQE